MNSMTIELSSGSQLGIIMMALLLAGGAGVVTIIVNASGDADSIQNANDHSGHLPK